MVANGLKTVSAVVLAALWLGLVAGGGAGPAAARETPESFSALSRRLTPAVVNIATTQKVRGVGEIPAFPRGSPLERFNEELDLDGAEEVNSLGSGFVISGDGVIVTNNHVIRDADTIEVIFADGRRVKAELVGADEATDLAVLRVAAPQPLPSVRFADSDASEVGEWVIAIGNPFGLGASVSAGIISARNRSIGAGAFDDFLQTDAAINRGNSGGPLFNLDGDVIGVNTAIISPTGASAGVGFATPSNLAKSVVGQILKFGEARRGWIGARVRALTPDAARRNGVGEERGVLITGLVEDGPAAKAGLRPGDVILTLAGRDVRDVRAFIRLEADAEIGKPASVTFLRGGQSRSVSVAVARTPGGGAQAARPSAPQLKPTPPAAAGAAGPQGIVLGMRLSELTPDIRRRFRVDPDIRGLLVMSLEPGSPAASTLKAGDVIVELQFEAVETVAEARAQAARQEGKGPILLYIDRAGDKTFRRLNPR